MAPAVLLRGGGTLYWVEPGRGIVANEPVDPDPVRSALLIAAGYHDIPESRRRRWALPAGNPLGSAEPALAELFEKSGIRVAVASPAVLRAARALLPARTIADERRLLLPLARRAVAGALGGTEETLIALAREEARVERVALLHLPNLSRLVGAKVASRLLAAAGSRRALARMSASRLQLLGARRRPSPDRGPRFGVIYRAAGLDQLPPDRQGRYARSLAALAVIAARADEWTHRDLGITLVDRRDRRAAQLSGGSR